MKLVDVGFGNTVNAARVVAVITADAAPTKRIISAAKDKFMAIDATCGRKTKTVIIMDSGHIIMSAKDTEKISALMEKSDE